MLTSAESHYLWQEVIGVTIEVSCSAYLFIHLAICDKLLWRISHNNQRVGITSIIIGKTLAEY